MEVWIDGGMRIGGLGQAKGGSDGGGNKPAVRVHIWLSLLMPNRRNSNAVLGDRRHAGEACRGGRSKLGKLGKSGERQSQRLIASTRNEAGFCPSEIREVCFLIGRLSTEPEGQIAGLSESCQSPTALGRRSTPAEQRYSLGMVLQRKRRLGQRSWPRNRQARAVLVPA
ncbi:unnamed protein product [Protopolystoma xenopodis]|uniref:Uncharacterized protein n=1 Tax=Protopolystoma xenopodis TaxID=117903 RepID=A0A3S5BW26_9PLAT|nr:unnamed protein product [Protopolystoma xenopodis]